MSTDNEVIERSVGSPEEFAALYDRHAGTIHRYAARRIGAEVADDILSETFLVAFDKRRAFDAAATSALPWLLGIATTLLKQHARRLWTHGPAGMISHNQSSTPDPAGVDLRLGYSI